MSDLADQTEPKIEIGRVRRAVGLDGRVDVELYSGDINRLKPGTRLHAGDRHLTVAIANPGRKGGFSVHFEEIADREAAEGIRGVELELPESEVPPPAADTYYHYQIIGSTVVHTDGRRIGTVTAIMETGSNDVYVVSTESDKEILIPATRNTVKEVDTLDRVITVELPEQQSGSESREDR